MQVEHFCPETKERVSGSGVAIHLFISGSCSDRDISRCLQRLFAQRIVLPALADGFGWKITRLICSSSRFNVQSPDQPNSLDVSL
jgi:hypothetical protein